MLRTLIIATAVAVAPFSARAELRSEMLAYVVSVGEDGTERFAPAATVKPGQTIEYRMRHTNTFDDAIGGVTVIGPVPEGGEYVPGKRYSNAPAVFEVRGEFDPDRPGEEWSALPASRIVVGNDGTRRTEEAKPEHFTAIRWRLSEPMQRDASVVHAYRVEVK